MLFRLAEILRPEQLGQTGDLRSVTGRAPDELDGAIEVLLRVGSTLHLDQRYFCGGLSSHANGRYHRVCARNLK
jgi:hypothetical protein